MNQAIRQAIVAHRLENAHKTLAELPILMENKLWNTAVNRLYYACYYAVSALLISYNIEAKTHSGVRSMLGMNFTKTEKLSIEMNKFYFDLFENRQASDYADFIYFDRETVDELYQQAALFIKTIEKLIKK